MKAILILFVFEVLSISTSYAQENQVEKNIQHYEATWDKVINKGQIDQINSENFDEKVTMIMSPQNIVGIEGFKDYYQNFLTGFSNIQFTIKDAFGHKDKLVKHWRFKGKHTGDFFGIPPTGRSVDIEGVTLVEMKDGKIFQEQDFLDSMVFMQQLGLVSDPDNIKTVNSLYEAFAAGNIPAVLEGLAPQIEWREAEGNKYADGNPYIGPEAVLEGIFSRIGEEHEYFKLKDIELHEMNNNQVLAKLRYDGKWKGGEAYDAQAAHVWTLKDGKVIAFQQYVDTKKLADSEQKGKNKK